MHLKFDKYNDVLIVYLFGELDHHNAEVLRVKIDDRIDRERIKNGLKKGYNIAFMCTEKEPEDCHRCILIGRYFNDIGYQVINIIDEKNYKTQNVIEQDLLNEYFPERNQISLIPDLNKSDEELIRDAYKLKNKKIGYRLED